MTIDQFKSALANGGVRPTLFQVSGSVGPFPIESKQQFLIKAASLPASTLGVIEFAYKGRKIPVPGDRTFEPWTITIIADGKLDLRKKFEKWSNLINDYATNTPGVGDEQFTPGAPNNIFQDWTVQQLNRQDQVIHEYKFVGCWPTSISSIDLNYESTDTVSEFTVELQFSHFEPLGI